MLYFFPLHSLTHFTSKPCSSTLIGAAEALADVQECSAAAPFFLGTTAVYLLGLVLFRVPFMSRLDRILSLTVGFLQVVTALLLVLRCANAVRNGAHVADPRYAAWSRRCGQKYFVNVLDQSLTLTLTSHRSDHPNGVQGATAWAGKGDARKAACTGILGP